MKKTSFALTALCLALAGRALASGVDWDTVGDPMTDFAAQIEANKQRVQDEEAAAVRMRRAAAEAAEKARVERDQAKVRALADFIWASRSPAVAEPGVPAFLDCADRPGLIDANIRGYGVKIAADAVRCSGPSGESVIFSAEQCENSRFELVSTPGGPSYLIDKTQVSSTGSGDDVTAVAYTADQIGEAVRLVKAGHEAATKAAQPQAQPEPGFFQQWESIENAAAHGDPLMQ